MRRPFICIILTYIFLLSACGRNEQYEHEANPYAFQYALHRASLRREEIKVPGLADIIPLTEGRIPSTGAGLVRVAMRRPAPDYLSVQDAALDARLFFETLRGYYSGYLYFGGNAVFNEVLATIEAELLALQVEMITHAQFVEIMYRHLVGIIRDCHFRFYYYTLSFGMDYFRAYCDTPLYMRNENGFKNINTGAYLIEIKGYEIEQVMRLFADERGDIFYRPILLKNMLPFLENILYQHFTGQEIERATVPVYFLYEGNNQNIYTFTQTMRMPQINTRELPSLVYKYNIPILTVSVMGFDGVHYIRYREHVAPFLHYAQYLQNEPFIILDLRNAVGGNGFLPIRWLYELTGEIIRSNKIMLVAEPYTGDEARDYFFLKAGNAYDSHFLSPRVKPVGGGYYTIRGYNENPREIIEREQLLIILTSNSTASAAELLIDLTFNVTNTILIGTPTQGALLSDMSLNPLFLPRSGIPFGFGRALSLFNEDHFLEGAGFTPDVWVDGDALAVALALLRNAGLLNA